MTVLLVRFFINVIGIKTCEEGMGTWTPILRKVKTTSKLHERKELALKPRNFCNPVPDLKQQIMKSPKKTQNYAVSNLI